MGTVFSDQQAALTALQLAAARAGLDNLLISLSAATADDSSETEVGAMHVPGATIWGEYDEMLRAINGSTSFKKLIRICRMRSLDVLPR